MAGGHEKQFLVSILPLAMDDVSESSLSVPDNWTTLYLGVSCVSEQATWNMEDETMSENVEEKKVVTVNQHEALIYYLCWKEEKLLWLWQCDTMMHGSHDLMSPRSEDKSLWSCVPCTQSWSWWHGLTWCESSIATVKISVFTIVSSSTEHVNQNIIITVCGTQLTIFGKN